MKYILVSNGKRLALVDDEDYLRVSKYRWYLENEGVGYAKNGKVGKLHRFILGAPDGVFVDHINGLTMDNQRSNLRLCDKAENCRNVAPTKKNSSGYKGVSWNKDRKRWTAHIKGAGKSRYLGLFDTKEQAAEAYNKAAKEFFGEFAWLNPLKEDRK